MEEVSSDNIVNNSAARKLIMSKKKFSNVYYIWQIKPSFRICGYTFDKTEAERTAKHIEKLTKGPSRIIKFTRDEIEALAFND